MKKGGDHLPSLSQSLSYATSCLNKSFQYATVRAVDACECSRLKSELAVIFINRCARVRPGG